MNHYINAFANYFNFKGRTSRKGFWIFVLFHFIFLFSISFASGFYKSANGHQSLILLIVYVSYSLLSIIPYFAIIVRRIHDVGKSAWFGFIPIYGLYLVCLSGDEGENEYGSSQV